MINSVRHADNIIVLNRVLEISQENRYVSLNRGFAVIKEKDTEIGSVPLDDIAVMLLSAQSVTITKNVLNALAEKGCVTVLCGKNYIPMSMVIPEYSHYLFAKILKGQINASLPFKKRVWQQIVIRKIQNQAIALRVCGKNDESEVIDKISVSVDSGDTSNREGYAAKMYFKFLFGEEFCRDREEEGVNSLLNYGYAIMRAAMARAVCSSGLLPALGIHHENNLKQFCLVDDLFEIYRAMVDCVVYKLVQDGESEVTPAVKKILAKLLNARIMTVEGVSTVVKSMRYYAMSFVKALEYKKPVIELPVWEGDEYGITILE